MAGRKRKEQQDKRASFRGPGYVSDRASVSAADRKKRMEKIEEKNPRAFAALDIHAASLYGIAFAAHEKRAEGVIATGSKVAADGIWGRRFAFTGAAREALKRRMGDNPGAGLTQSLSTLYRDIRGADRLMPSTLSSNAWLGSARGPTNDQIAADNYEFALNNIGQIQANIGRILMAKIDADLNVRETFADFFDPNGK